MTFPEFESKCNQWYGLHRTRFCLSDLRVWNQVPGDTMTDRDVWYCIVNLRRNVNMILTYDHSGELDEPFAVYVDWATGSLNLKQLPIQKFRGYTTMVGEYLSFNSATDAMLEEPTPFLQSENDGFGIGRYRDSNEKKSRPDKGEWDAIDIETCSFLECLQRLKEMKADRLCEWGGRKMCIYHRDPSRDVVYTTII